MKAAELDLVGWGLIFVGSCLLIAATIKEAREAGERASQEIFDQSCVLHKEMHGFSERIQELEQRIQVHGKAGAQS